MQKIGKFNDNHKTCNVCREKAQRLQQRHKDRLNQQNKEHKASNPEKVKEWTQNRFNRIKDEVVTCPVCKYEIRKYKQAQHEKSQTQQYYMQKLTDPILRRMFPNQTRSER